MTRTYPLDGEILGPDDPVTLRGRERLEGKAKRVRKSFFKTVRKALGQIPFMEDVIAAYYCAFDPTTPTKVRATLLGALAYFVLPLDAVPDFILGVGFADDASVLMAAIALVTTSIREEHRVAARKVLAEMTRQD
ncbi:YkvA family protein [Breoghania sp.]|uniref:YkvA family protein n=1 Tax=Breoghania sp. TaxID=2065378 RepID=UPI002AA6F642|nr:YkvA family protein [Breoghania sp.]